MAFTQEYKTQLRIAALFILLIVGCVYLLSLFAVHLRASVVAEASGELVSEYSALAESAGFIDVYKECGIEDDLTRFNRLAKAGDISFGEVIRFSNRMVCGKYFTVMLMLSFIEDDVQDSALDDKNKQKISEKLRDKAEEILQGSLSSEKLRDMQSYFGSRKSLDNGRMVFKRKGEFCAYIMTLITGKIDNLQIPASIESGGGVCKSVEQKLFTRLSGKSLPKK